MQVKEDKFLGFRSPLDPSKSRLRHAFGLCFRPIERGFSYCCSTMAQSIENQKSISDMF